MWRVVLWCAGEVRGTLDGELQIFELKERTFWHCSLLPYSSLALPLAPSGRFLLRLW